MLKTLRAFTLIAALSVTAQAGVVLTPPESDPPPPQASAQDGQMETPLLAQIVLALSTLL